MKTSVHQMALAFSREIGTEPQLSANPELTRATLFGPLAAVSFRIWGPEPLPEAAGRFQKEAREFGAVPTPELTPAQEEQLQALERGRSKKAA